MKNLRQIPSQHRKEQRKVKMSKATKWRPEPYPKMDKNGQKWAEMGKNQAPMKRLDDPRPVDHGRHNDATAKKVACTFT